MTNGEKLKEIFPYLESDNTDLVKVLNIDYLKSWRNAEYQEPLKQEQKWISVGERLPESDGHYLVTEKSGRVCIYVFHKEGNSEEYWKRCVVAWMPLPKGYGEGRGMTRKEKLRKVLDKVLWTRNASDENKDVLVEAIVEALEQEPQTFKWCTSCREYDQEKHCCHRWSKVIRNTVEEMKQEYIEREVLDKVRSEIERLPITDTAVRLVTEILDKYKEENDPQKSEDKE